MLAKATSLRTGSVLGVLRDPVKAISSKQPSGKEPQMKCTNLTMNKTKPERKGPAVLRPAPLRVGEGYSHPEIWDSPGLGGSFRLTRSLKAGMVGFRGWGLRFRVHATTA